MVDLRGSEESDEKKKMMREEGRCVERRGKKGRKNARASLASRPPLDTHPRLAAGGLKGGPAARAGWRDGHLLARRDLGGRQRRGTRTLGTAHPRVPGRVAGGPRGLEDGRVDGRGVGGCVGWPAAAKYHGQGEAGEGDGNARVADLLNPATSQKTRQRLRLLRPSPSALYMAPTPGALRQAVTQARTSSNCAAAASLARAPFCARLTRAVVASALVLPPRRPAGLSTPAPHRPSHHQRASMAVSAGA